MARSIECRCEHNFTCGYCLRNAALRNNNWTTRYQDVRPVPYVGSLTEELDNEVFNES